MSDSDFDDRYRVLGFLRDAGGELSTSDFYRLVDDKTDGAIRQLLANMAKEGTIDRIKHGVYSLTADDLAQLRRERPGSVRQRVGTYRPPQDGNADPGAPKGEPKAEPPSAPTDPSTPVRWGGALIRSPREIADRIPVPVVEVSGGPGGMAAVEEATLRTDYFTPRQWAQTFSAPLAAAGTGRHVLGHLRGESMIPRYYDRQEVPLELFEHPRPDVGGGDVFLVLLDGHLHLKLVDRHPAARDRPAALTLGSFNDQYRPIEVPLDGSVDVAVLGRTVESNRDRLFAALAARAFRL